MSEPDSKMLDYLKRVTAELARTKEYVAQLESAGHPGEDDPIVIVSMGCRFGGGIDSPDDLWDVVRSGRDVVGPFPADRGWPDLHTADALGSDTDRGAFVDGAAEFDAEFFGISPHEARAMDPQQRLALEVAWETIERARVDPLSLRESRTGVYLGATSFGYGGDYLGDSDDLGGHLVTGNVTSVLSGRISYALGLRGPALTLDTACSSALVAMDLAAQSLRRGESTLALAGGAAIMSSPGVFVEFSRQGGLSPDGLCKSFAAAADGTGWGEGVAMVLLEKKSDAERLGHPVLAVLRGSAVNQDGASNGLTAPNGRAQQDVIKAALADAGLTADDVDAVEAHGTGTRLGDPIEATAVLGAYGRARVCSEPLYLGSVKSNIAHTQAAAGAGSVIKSVLALRHGVLAKSLHIDEPTAEVSWNDSSVELLTEERQWPSVQRPRRIGVSGFGVSGTNAHLILEQAPAQPRSTEPEPVGPRVFALSGRTPAALAAQAQNVGAFYAETGTAPAELAAALAETRSVLEERGAFVAGGNSGKNDSNGNSGNSGNSDIDKLLSLVADGTAHESIHTGSARVEARPVFVFPGQGSQWVGMGAELARRSEVFRTAFTDCAAELDRYLDYSVEDVLFERAGAPTQDRVDVVQPMLFAVMVSLAALWRSVGVVPSAVVGHSQGEIAAAYVAGGLSLADAAAIVALRSRALIEITGTGGMLALATTESVARGFVGDGPAAVAAVNGPLSVVVSGPTEELDRITAEAAAQQIRTWKVDVDYASHSSAVDAISASLSADLAGVAPKNGDVVFLSTVTGDAIPTPELGGDYWVRNLREPVRLDRAVESALRRRHRVFVEISPHPVLSVALSSTIDAAQSDAVVLDTVRRDDGGIERWMSAAAAGHVHGLTVDISVVNAQGQAAYAGAGAVPEHSRPRVDLPTYPFQRNRFWYVPSGRERPAQETATVYRTEWESAELPEPVASNPRVLVLHSGSDDSDVTAGVDAVARIRLSPGFDEAVVRAALLDHDPDVVLWVVGRSRDAMSSVQDASTIARALNTQAALWVLTRGGAAIVSGEPVDPSAFALHGLLGSFDAEQPGRFGGSIDLSLGDTGDRSDVVTTLLQAGSTRERYALRGDTAYRSRLTRSETAAPATETTQPGVAGRGGTALITGGTGGLGRALAVRLAEGGVDALVLLSRSGRGAEGSEALLNELSRLGTRAEIVRCDVTDHASVAAVVGKHRPTAIFHLAGVVDDCAVADLDPDRLRAATSAAVLGADALHAATQEHPVDEFVVFSALAGTVGVSRQGAYGAAAAYLDGLVHRRRADGLAATSVGFSALVPSGLVDDAAAEVLRARGITPVQAARAFAVVDALAAAAEPVTVVADVDWSTFLASGAVAETPALSGILTSTTENPRTPDTQRSAELRSRIRGLPATARPQALLPTVIAALGSALGYSAEDSVDPDRSFVDLGGDSLAAIRLRTALASSIGLTFPVTVAFEHPSARALAAHACELLAADTDDSLTAIGGDAKGSNAKGRDAKGSVQRTSVENASVDRLLDGLDSGLDTIVDEGDRRRVASRLRLLSRRLGIDHGAAAPVPDTIATPQTDDELFAALDQELGVSK